MARGVVRALAELDLPAGKDPGRLPLPTPADQDAPAAGDYGHCHLRSARLLVTPSILTRAAPPRTLPAMPPIIAWQFLLGRSAAHGVHREGIGVLPAPAPGVLRSGRVRPAGRCGAAAGSGPRPVHHRPGRFLADINALHPFREGNGCAQRAFFSQLAHDAGHHIAWVRMDPDRNMAASAAAHYGDLARLRGNARKFSDAG